MYVPTAVPSDPKAIPNYLALELQALSQALNASQPFSLLQQLNVAPKKPRAGMVALADGVNWNPGAGAGYYGYRGGAWHLLG